MTEGITTKEYALLKDSTFNARYTVLQVSISWPPLSLANVFNAFWACYVLPKRARFWLEQLALLGPITFPYGLTVCASIRTYMRHCICCML